MAIDAVWLKFVANSFYKKQLGSLLRAKPDFAAAAIFYVLYIFAIIFFAVNPALGLGSFGYAISHAALLGLVMYATYDLTNQSTLKHWPLKITIVDMAWGTFITSLIAVLTYVIFA